MRCPNCNAVVMKAEILRGAVEVQCNRCAEVFIVTNQQLQCAIPAYNTTQQQPVTNVFPVAQQCRKTY